MKTTSDSMKLSIGVAKIADAVEDLARQLDAMTEITITEQVTREVSRVSDAIENCYGILHSKKPV